MSVWPVFVLAEMHLDEGSPFSVGEIASWPVELRDGLDTGCPRNELRDVSATLKASDASSVAGSLAVMPGLSVWWRGPQPPGCTLTMSAVGRRYPAAATDHDQRHRTPDPDRE
jgi:hypothetical protein